MSYFSKLIIEGFQSHSYTEVALDQGLNVITGPSDSGKSAIIRALRWVLFNEPRGSDFIRQGETLCRVTLLMSDGKEIIRERSRGKNRYILRQGEEELVFEGFSQTGVPEEVMAAHGVCGVRLDEEQERNISFGQQLEGPFLLSESASLKAKAIGRIAGVHIIDAASRSVQRDIGTLNRQEREGENRLKDINESLETYQDIEALSEALATLKLVREKIRNLENRMTMMEAKREAYQGLYDRYEAILNIQHALENIDAAIQSENILEEKLQTLNKLESYAIELEDKRKRLAFAKLYIEKTEQVSDATQSLQKSEGLYEKGIRLQNILREYVEKRRSLQAINEVVHHTEHLPQLEQQIHQLEYHKDRYNLLTQKEIEIQRVQDEEHKLKSLFEKTKGMEGIKEKLRSAGDRLELLQKLKPLYLEKEKLARDLTVQKEILIAKDREIHDLLEEYKQLLQTVGKCPTCFTDMTPEALRRVTAEYEKGVLQNDQEQLRTAN